MRKSIRTIPAFLVCLCGFLASKPLKFTVTPELQAAMDSIRADALRGDLSFLASDLLEGRDTPSRGLDIAAEYIAARFRAAGLEPGGDNQYFQTARMALLEPDLNGFGVTLSHAGRSVTINPADAELSLTGAVELEAAPVFKLDLADTAQVDGITPADLDGKVLLLEVRRDALANFRTAARAFRAAKPAAILIVDKPGNPRETRGPQLVDPESLRPSAPRITLTSQSAAGFYNSLKPGLSGAAASIHIAAPRQTPVALHNVIGILRGSDPALKDTAGLLTAHYDHIGMRPAGPADRIYNGANDDGSGTVSVIEIARALASVRQRPRRTIIFMTFFGEEKGMLGSRYYVRHPAWPIEKTVAQLNLEQVGRTDATEGRQLSSAALTGLDYSDLAGYIQGAGELTGIRIQGNSRNTDSYFSAGDNISFAEAGVPAHSLCVAFNFPDYHGVGDEWQKIDYDNMAKVDRMAALALVMLADSEEVPHWSEGNLKAAPFLKAWRERHK